MPPAAAQQRVQETAEGAAVRSLDGRLMRLAEARVTELEAELGHETLVVGGAVDLDGA